MRPSRVRGRHEDRLSDPRRRFRRLGDRARSDCPEHRHPLRHHCHRSVDTTKIARLQGESSSKPSASVDRAGIGAINRTIGPNPTTFAKATGQAHSCRRRIPSPVPKATIAANPLRNAWPAASKWAHNIERSTTTIQAAAGHVGLLGPGSNEAVKRESRIARAAAKEKTQYGAPDHEAEPDEPTDRARAGVLHRAVIGAGRIRLEPAKRT